MGQTVLPSLGAGAFALVGESHSRRVRLLILAMAWTSILVGIFWAVFFAFSGDWPVTVSDILLTLAGVVCLRMVQRKRLREAAAVLVASLLIRIFFMAATLDIATPEIPRSLHHFLVPVGLAAYLMLKHEAPWLRDGLAWGCLATVVFLGSTDFSFSTPYALRDEIRGPGTWANNACAMGLTFLLLHLFVTDIDKLERRIHRWRAQWVRLVHALVPGGWGKNLARFDQGFAPLIPRQTLEISAAGTRVWVEMQARRVRLMVLVTSILLVVLGSMFAVYFASQGAWVLTLTEVMLAAFGFGWAKLDGNPRHRTATLMLSMGLMLIFAINSVTMDIPTPAFPRSSHYYFLTLSLVAYFLLREADNWIHIGVPLLGLVLFVGLASSNGGIWTAYSLPDNLRPPAWFNSTVALGVLYLMVHILVGEIRWLESRVLGGLNRLAALGPALLGKKA